MDPITAVILEMAKVLGIPPVAAATLIPLIILFANRIARIIPDTATGWLKYVRIVAVVIGAHVKDNSGVPAIATPSGNVIRQSTAEQAPEDIQGVLRLDDTMRVDMFRRGNQAIQSRGYGNEG